MLYNIKHLHTYTDTHTHIYIPYIYITYIYIYHIYIYITHTHIYISHIYISHTHIYIYIYHTHIYIYRYICIYTHRSTVVCPASEIFGLFPLCVIPSPLGPWDRGRGQPAAYQALGRVMDAAACCDKAKLPNFPDQALRTLVDVGDLNQKRC